MAMQLPPAFNALSLPAVDQAVQQNEFNALRNDALQQQSTRAQTEWDDGRKQQAQQMLYQMASKSKQVMQQNPNAWAQLLPEWQKNLSEAGLPVDKIPPAGAAPESVMEGLDNILMSADLGGGAPEQVPLTKNDLVKVQGDNGPIYAAAPDAIGQGVPQSAISQAKDPASITEYKLYRDQAIAAGQEPMPLIDFIKEVNAQKASGRVGGALDAEIDRTDDVADSRSTVAGAVSFAQQDNKQRSQSIQSSVESIEKINANNANLDRAVTALDQGAKSGPIISQYTPTIRAATIALETVKNNLGLDVVGATTFGALSKGELDLALNTAMPNLPPEELKQWIIDKKAANTKLRDYYMEQVDWLRKGGSVDTFMQYKEDLNAAKSGGDFQSQWDAAASGTVLQAPDGTMRRKP